MLHVSGFGSTTITQGTGEDLQCGSSPPVPVGQDRSGQGCWFTSLQAGTLQLSKSLQGVTSTGLLHPGPAELLP